MGKVQHATAPPPIDAWKMIAALPGVDIPKALDGGTLAAIGSSDPRYAWLLANEPGVAEYLAKFETPFGRKLKPTLLVSRREVERLPPERVSDFRNLVALAHVLHSRMQTHWSQRLAGVPFSDLFDIYPIALSRFPDTVYFLTTSEHGMDDLAKLKIAQPAPTFAYPEHLRAECDEGFAQAALELWREDPRRGPKAELARRLFRSFSVAYYGLRAPIANLRSTVDIALPMAMMVSAFEVLAQPADGGDVKWFHVANLIRSVPWTSTRLSRRRFSPLGYKRQGKELPTTLPVQIYLRLYRLRNKVLHGDPLQEGATEPGRRKSWGSLLCQAPVLYRNVVLWLLARRGFGRFPVKEPTAEALVVVLGHSKWEAALCEP
ncbi:MAG: hypothetical protein ACRD1B_03665, partial [Thermoanaerobaculia bacterium]